MVPVFKKGDREVVKNNRTIFLLCILSKVLERCLYNHVALFVRPQIYLHQHGFLSGRSTVTQLLCFLHEAGATLDKSGQLDIAYLDYSKVFDSVSHKGLIYKLKHHSIDGPLLVWLTDYLKNHQQRVVIDNSCSTFCPVSSGVPQGSILGPLLFLIFINDILQSVCRGSSVALFADDS